jgi:multiple sugar transport system permease protein
MKLQKKSRVFIYTMLIIMTLYFLFPFFWMIITAFKTEAEANSYPPAFLPEKWLFSNFFQSWMAQDFNLYLFNSLAVTILHTLGILISCSLTAYGFARFSFRGKNVLFMIMLMTMMIPWDVTMIPQYMEFKIFGWINSLKALIIPGFMGSAYYIFLLRQFMMGIPRDLDEAARLDGANQFVIYSRIFIPIMKPALILVAILNSITVWNDYLGPLIFLQSRNKYTLALGLAAFKGVHETRTIPLMCITVLMIIPPVILFIVTQKHVIEQTSGAIK